MKSVAIVFRRQPRETIKPNEPAYYLSTLRERLQMINSIGIGDIIEVDFNENIRSLTIKEFLKTLYKYTGLRVLVLGTSAKMGTDLAGIEAITETARTLNIETVRISEHWLSDKIMISSSAVRAALHKGDVRKAQALLGRQYALEGTVVEGDKRGRLLGYPTANIDLNENLMMPADGIYATKVKMENALYLAATSIGLRPTFGGTQRTVETHILDYEGDLYGASIRVQFAERLREEIRFKSSEDLISQIKRDIENIRRMPNILQ